MMNLQNSIPPPNSHRTHFLHLHRRLSSGHLPGGQSPLLPDHRSPPRSALLLSLSIPPIGATKSLPNRNPWQGSAGEMSGCGAAQGRPAAPPYSGWWWPGRGADASPAFTDAGDHRVCSAPSTSSGRQGRLRRRPPLPRRLSLRWQQPRRDGRGGGLRGGCPEWYICPSWQPGRGRRPRLRHWHPKVEFFSACLGFGCWLLLLVKYCARAKFLMHAVPK
jgi:hypothetical protein